MLNDPLVATLLIGDFHHRPVPHPGPVLHHVLQLPRRIEPLDSWKFRRPSPAPSTASRWSTWAALGEGRVTGPLTMPPMPTRSTTCSATPQDLDKARELMAQAGLEEGFTLPVMVANAEPPTALSEAQNIQPSWPRSTSPYEIEALELSVYVDRWLAGDFTSCVALNGGRTDPYTMYARYWQHDARFQNVAGYIDDDLDSLMKQGQSETDPAARIEIFKELERQLAEKAPWVWLYAGYTYTAAQPAVVGWEPGANDSLYYLYEVSLQR
jgi:peptide/nickel transport system substrate-binding protein